ncbi:hypothetical protein Leryth_017418 [Lithospermum erythrorhizon]|nr:hypothetical protein Leryth_017418 [Lithospermum erythrorhizon]
MSKIHNHAKQNPTKIPNHKQKFNKTKQILPLSTQSSNPHLINQKIHSLEAIINDIEASKENGIKINDPKIFASLLENCFKLCATHLVTRIHNIIPEKLLYINIGIVSKLLRLYSKNGNLEEAHRLFDKMLQRNESAFSWNSLISGYADNGLYEDALALYFQMTEEDVEPDGYTFPRVLKACGGVGLIHVGEEIHRHAIRFGFGNDVCVQNALVDMYSKCGDIEKAWKIFNQIDHKDLVSWNSMLRGFVRHQLIEEAINVFRGMLYHGHEPDAVSLSTVLTGLSSSCVQPEIHGWVLRRGVERNLSIANSLIVYYSKQCELEKLRWLFNNMSQRDIVSWNSIISAHSKQIEALEYFESMLSSDVSPDKITFVSLLSACARMGMVKEGQSLFTMMRDRYRIDPVMEHYACLVNLYARVGFVEEALEIIDGMEFDAGPTVWGPLLYGCFLHGNVDIAEIACENLFELEPDNEQNFELLMKVYHNAGRLEDVEKVRLMMVERGLD